MQKLEVKNCLCGVEPEGPAYYSPSDGYQANDGYFRIKCKKCGARACDKDVIDCICKWNVLVRGYETASSEWYPADKIIPENGTKVLVCHSDGKIETGYFNEDEMCFITPDGFPPVDSGVYWLFLPDPPNSTERQSRVVRATNDISLKG